MKLNDFIDKKLYLDIESLGMDTAKFRENSNNKYKKILYLVEEINNKKIIGIEKIDNQLIFRNIEGKKVGISGVNREFKERIIKANLFTYSEKHKLFVFNRVFFKYKDILTSNNKYKVTKININDKNYEITSGTHMKESYIEKDIKKSGNEKIFDIPKVIFTSYYLYESESVYVNTFGLTNEDGEYIRIASIDSGVYRTGKYK